MTGIKKYITTLLMLMSLVVTMTIPAAHSFVYNWDTQTNYVCFEHDYQQDITVDESVNEDIRGDIRLTNVGTSTIYVTANITFTAISKEDGQPLTDVIVKPEDTTLNWNINAINDGLWILLPSNEVENEETVFSNCFLWSKALLPTESTDTLIDSVIINSTDYDIRIDITPTVIPEQNISEWCTTYGLNFNSTENMISISI